MVRCSFFKSQSQPCDLLSFFSRGYVDIDFHFTAHASSRPRWDAGKGKQKTYGFCVTPPRVVNHAHEHSLT